MYTTIDCTQNMYNKISVQHQKSLDMKVIILLSDMTAVLNQVVVLLRALSKLKTLNLACLRKFNEYISVTRYRDMMLAKMLPLYPYYYHPLLPSLSLL